MIDSALPHDKVNYPINVTQIFQKKVMRDSNFQLFFARNMEIRTAISHCNNRELKTFVVTEIRLAFLKCDIPIYNMGFSTIPC